MCLGMYIFCVSFQKLSRLNWPQKTKTSVGSRIPVTFPSHLAFWTSLFRFRFQKFPILNLPYNTASRVGSQNPYTFVSDSVSLYSTFAPWNFGYWSHYHGHPILSLISITFYSNYSITLYWSLIAETVYSMFALTTLHLNSSSGKFYS